MSPDSWFRVFLVVVVFVFMIVTTVVVGGDKLSLTICIGVLLVNLVILLILVNLVIHINPQKYCMVMFCPVQTEKLILVGLCGRNNVYVMN